MRRKGRNNIIKGYCKQKTKSSSGFVCIEKKKRSVVDRQTPREEEVATVGASFCKRLGLDKNDWT
jgi:hypothetical protein